MKILTVRMETTRDKDGVFFRAGFHDHMGPWMRSPDSAFRKLLDETDPRELLEAIGISPVLTEEVAGLCKCGAPYVEGTKGCC